MTKPQLDALQSYVAAVVRIMTKQGGDHSANVRLMLECKKRLESAFGQELDAPYSNGPVDLFADVPTPTQPVFPDLL